MTFQPPPPPPPPPAGPPAPPPPGGHRPAAFDPKNVNSLDWGILAAGLLAFIFSFVSYYTYTVSFSGFGGATGSWNAWHGFFGWFAMLCAVIGSGVIAVELFAPTVKLPFAARLTSLAAYALATLCVVLALFLVPNPGGYGGPGIDKGHGIGYWLSLIVIIAGLVLTLMRFQQGGGKLPGPLANMPNIGARGPGGQQPTPPPMSAPPVTPPPGSPPPGSPPPPSAP